MDFLFTPTAQAILMTLVLAIMILVSVMVLGKLRNFADEDRVDTSKMMTNFEELREQGDISDEEFRKVKSVLREKLQHELNDNGDMG